jgi:hypothetical protein
MSNGMCLALPGEIYSLYLPDGGSGMLDLSHTTGPFNVEWFDPRNGGALVKGTISEVMGGEAVSIGLPPADPDQDWTCLIRAAPL